jgi:hypothetical protein
VRFQDEDKACTIFQTYLTIEYFYHEALYRIMFWELNFGNRNSFFDLKCYLYLHIKHVFVDLYT